jgi:TolB-like protein/Tfp pilus assembly protein PilF
MKEVKPLTRMRIVIVFLILIGVTCYFIFPKLKGGIKEKKNLETTDQSIAVLPFVNISKDTSQEYFSDGLTDGIQNSLAHLKGLKVCARTSSFQFKKKNFPIKEARRILGVRTILEGSVQIDGDRIIITANLVNVGDSLSLWSGKYDENMDNIFALQDKIVNAIAEKLEITLLQNQGQTAAKKPTTNIEAYELYLKGRSSWNLRTPPDLKKGIDFFQQAIAIDPSYAAAYSGVADCYTALGYGSFMAPKEAFPKALEAATKAIKLDSTLAEPHASLGYYNFYYAWDWAAAEQEFRTAIALNPNYELGYDWYGYYLTAMKRYDEAKVILEKAKELDPLSVPITTDMGFSVLYSGDYDLAFKKLQAALQMNPRFLMAHIWMGRTYQVKKMYPEAIGEYKKALELSMNWPVALSVLGNVYGMSGDKANAQKILDTLAQLSSKKFVTSYGVATVYTGLGEKDKAFEWLNKAYDERSNWLVWLKADPRWTPLKTDKRYIELVNKVGLPQ